jgi:hypothetical protein
MATTMVVGSIAIWKINIPTVMGKIIIAPNALVMGITKRIPPMISIIVTNGHTQPVAMMEPIDCMAASESSMGM